MGAKRNSKKLPLFRAFRSQRHQRSDQIERLGPAAGLQSDIRRRYCVCTRCLPDYVTPRQAGADSPHDPTAPFLLLVVVHFLPRMIAHCVIRFHGSSARGKSLRKRRCFRGLIVLNTKADARDTLGVIRFLMQLTLSYY